MIVQGHQDVCLSEDGRNQANKLAAHVKSLGLSFDAVYSSDLIRARETAEIIVGSDKKDQIIVDERLRERSYGIFEGKNLKDLREAARQAGFNDKNYSSFLPEGAESLDEVHQRIQAFCHHQLLCSSQDTDDSNGSSLPAKGNSIPQDVTEVDVSSSPPKNILLVTHGGVIREFMRFFRDSLKCQLPEGVREPLVVTPNTGVSVFRINYRLNDAFNDQSTALLLRAECLQVHDTTHLKSEDFICPSQSSNLASSHEPKNHLLAETVVSDPGVDSLRADLHLA